jgi:hypothetical protein
MLIALISASLAAPAPLAAVPGVRLIASAYLDEAQTNRQYLALRPEAELDAVLKSIAGSPGQEVNSDGGSYSRHLLSQTTLDGLSLGDRWRLSGESTDVVCTVSAFELVRSPYDSGGVISLDGGAPCSAPLIVARMDCDQDASGAALAVPASAPRPVWGTLTDGDLSDGQRASILANETISGQHTSIAAEAAERGEPLVTDISTLSYRFGKHTIQAVMGTFYTGEGEDSCGGEDLVSRWSTLIIDGQPRAPETGGSFWLSGVVDIDGDGRPETLEWSDGRQQLRDADGNVLRAHNPDWCVCPC